MNINLDCFGKMITYLSAKDIRNLFFVSKSTRKYICKFEKIWKINTLIESYGKELYLILEESNYNINDLYNNFKDIYHEKSNNEKVKVIELFFRYTCREKCKISVELFSNMYNIIYILYHENREDVEYNTLDKCFDIRSKYIKKYFKKDEFNINNKIIRRILNVSKFLDNYFFYEYYYFEKRTEKNKYSILLKEIY